MIITSELRPQVHIEHHNGIDVVREDMCSAHLPSGKLRALIPWFQTYPKGTTVVNYAVSYSNSHAIVGYAAAATGLRCLTFVNCKYKTPQLALAEETKAEIVYAGPRQVGPLKAFALKNAPAGSVVLPWALAAPQAYRYVADLVDQVGYYDYHVVPVGGGGYIWAVAHGCRRNASRWGRRPSVLGVCSSGTVGRNYQRINAITPPISVELRERTKQLETPFPSDPTYEWWAWPLALALADTGKSVMFWCVGRPLVAENADEVSKGKSK